MHDKIWTIERYHKKIKWQPFTFFISERISRDKMAWWLSDSFLRIFYKNITQNKAFYANN